MHKNILINNREKTRTTSQNPTLHKCKSINEGPVGHKLKQTINMLGKMKLTGHHWIFNVLFFLRERYGLSAKWIENLFLKSSMQFFHYLLSYIVILHFNCLKFPDDLMSGLVENRPQILEILNDTK